MGRADRPEPFNTGRKGYREPDEPPDERPVIAYTDFRRGYKRNDFGRIVDSDTGEPPGDPFWRDRSEQLVYENAAESNPRKAGEGAFSYIQRLAAIAEQEFGRMKEMPQTKLTRRQTDERLAELRHQTQRILGERDE